MRFENLGFKDAVELYFNAKCILESTKVKQYRKDIESLSFIDFLRLPYHPHISKHMY